MRALSLVCSLNASPTPSSSQLLAEQVMADFSKLGAEGEAVRVADFDIRPGVDVDMGNGDQWPGLREKVLRPTSS